MNCITPLYGPNKVVRVSRDVLVRGAIHEFPTFPAHIRNADHSYCPQPGGMNPKSLLGTVMWIVSGIMSTSVTRKFASDPGPVSD